MAQDIDIHHTARLAQIGLSDAEAQRLSGELRQILGYITQLNELDTEDVPPTTHVAAPRPTHRPDVVTARLDRDRALAQAPETDGESFAVPRFL